MRTEAIIFAGTALLVVGGCNPTGTGNAGADANNSTEQSNEVSNSGGNSTQAASCPIEKNYDWLAEAHSQAGKKVAIITGKIDVKSEGYTASLAEGTLDAGPPPVQHATLTVIEPTSPNAQKTTTIDVTLTVPIAGTNEKVAIDCAGQEIARTDVVRP